MSHSQTCTVIMRNGVLQTGMTMPKLGPPPPDPHPNPAVQRMRDEWDLHIIGWECVFFNRPSRLMRRAEPVRLQRTKDHGAVS